MWNSCIMKSKFYIFNKTCLQYLWMQLPLTFQLFFKSQFPKFYVDNNFTYAHFNGCQSLQILGFAAVYSNEDQFNLFEVLLERFGNKRNIYQVSTIECILALHNFTHSYTRWNHSAEWWFLFFKSSRSKVVQENNDLALNIKQCLRINKSLTWLDKLRLFFMAKIS